MSDIETRLREAFGADAATVRPGTIRPFDEAAARPAATGRKPRPGGTSRAARLGLPLAAAVMVAALVLGLVIVVPRLSAGPTPPTSGEQHGQTPLTSAPRSFLTVSASAMVSRGDYLIRWPVSSLQLRSVRGGRVVATLLRSLGSISAAQEADGSVIAVADYGCRSQVYRINPQTGARSLIRTLPQGASAIALSPDARYLAYLTYPASDPKLCSADHQPTAPIHIQSNPGGLPGYLPSVVAVVNLATGAVVRAWTGNQGNPPFGGPAFSPDGKRIAIVFGNAILLMSTAHPSFATARRLSPPHGCGYAAATWTKAGVLGVLGCGHHGASLSPRTLVLLPAAGGRPTATWRLPACIDGVGLQADPTGRHVLVQSDIGYGSGASCGDYHTWHGQVAEIVGHRLKTVAILPYKNGTEAQVTAW
ncbi:MAG: hypothetical protein ACYCVZ_10535 [Streptosporangiaceae bacterium]